MAKYRKLGRTSDQRKALLRNQVTQLIYKGKIVTTEAKAKEIRKIAESMIALAIKEKDNFEEVEVSAKVAVKDKDGSFYVDGIGNLAMTSNGYNVMGWQVDPDTQDIKQDTVSALRIMSAENMTYEPEATTLARVTGILDKNDTNVTSTSGKIMNLMFYDKLGYAYTAKFNIKNTDEDGVYTLQLDGINDSLNKDTSISGKKVPTIPKKKEKK